MIIKQHISGAVALAMVAFIAFSVYELTRRHQAKPITILVTNTGDFRFEFLPPLNVPSTIVDANLATEFSLVVRSNTVLEFIHLINGRTLNLTVTNLGFTIGFANNITWMPTNGEPPFDVAGVSMFHFYQSDKALYGAFTEWNWKQN